VQISEISISRIFTEKAAMVAPSQVVEIETALPRLRLPGFRLCSRQCAPASQRALHPGELHGRLGALGILRQVLPVLPHVRPTSRRAPEGGTIPHTLRTAGTERATRASDIPPADLPSLTPH
jgi:hypothetical protein